MNSLPASARSRAPRRKSAHRLAIEHPPSLVEVIEERLRQAIVTAELQFGQSLSEADLHLGVSRTPLREALTRLEMQGLVQVVPKRGTFVFRPTVDDVRQLATFRLVLESSALEQSLANDPAGTLRVLKAELAKMQEARKRGNTLAYALADSAFHEAFFGHCGNVYLVEAFRNVSGRISALRAHLTLPRPTEQARSLAEHESIVAAFEGGAKREVKKILAEHILRAKDVYAEAIAGSAERSPENARATS